MSRSMIRVARPGLPVLAAPCLACLWGCQDPLLSPNEPRSQYDRYDQIRSERVEQWVVDEYGTRKPNLRGRLLK